VTLTVWLPRVIVPVREVVAVFAKTEKPMVPLPLPLPEVTLSQLPVLVAVAPLHAHPGCVVTETEPVLAAAGTVCDAGPRVNVQVGAAAWLTVALASPTLIVAERALPVLMVHVTVSDAFPRPDPGATVSHDAPLVACHSQPSAIPSDNVWVPGAVPAFTVVGLRLGVQLEPGPVRLPWTMVTDWVPIEIVASRREPWLSDSSKLIVAAPVPLAVRTRSQDAELTAVHAHPSIVSIVSVPRPLSAAKVSGDARSSNVHGRASWLMVTRWLLTTTAALRVVPASFRATVTARLASPCPEVEFNCIHDASLDAVHVQSRAAVMLTFTVAPFGGTAPVGPVSVV
jgi:hypothetical protein